MRDRHQAALTAQSELGQLLAAHLAAANLMGRLQVIRAVHRKTGVRVPLATKSRVHLGNLPLRHFAEGDMSVGYSFDIPPEGAIAYLRNLTPLAKDVFDGLSAQYRRLAFTVAGINDVKLIEKIRDALADVLSTGGTAQEFEAKVAQLTSEAGVTELTAFDLDTVFNTNMQKAYSLGRYEQMSDEAVKRVLPFWQYWTVGDDRVRPEHAVIDGFAALAEDPVWMKIYPPNGFNCRCSVVPIGADEAPDDAAEPGYARLPLLAKLKVPQLGFGKVFAV